MIFIKQGQVIEIAIDNLSSGGEGVGRWNKMAVFVPGALPGERARVRISQVKKSYARGELERLLETTSGRVEPECSDYSVCGGCNLQHFNYESQLVYKRQVVVDVLARIGKIGDVLVHPVIGMDNPWYYRNKVHLQVAGEKENLQLGFFAPGSHNLVSGSGHCRLVNRHLNVVKALLEELLNRYDVEPYHWKNRRGLLRHVMLRVGEATGEVMVVLVTAPGKWPQGQELARELMGCSPRVVSVVRNINNKSRQVVLGNKNQVLGGGEYITEKLNNLSFRLSANSFFQVNTIQAERLCQVALGYVSLTGVETLVDAYCGTGTIALYLVGSASRVVGLEIIPEAVEDAKANALLNGIKNVEFKIGPVEKLLPGLIKGGLKPGIVVLDPPRKGCEKEVLEAICASQVSRVVYVSCNPATLARDLGRLQDCGYRVVEVQPVDMFPWTGHVECIVQIKRAASRMA